MPTYRYRCGGCGEEFEVWQSITDDPIRTHDHGCGGELVKVLTPAGIVLKGSGFYRNDSRSGSKRGGGKSSGDGSGEGSGDKSDKAAASKDGDGKSKDGDGKKSSTGGDSSSSSTASSTTS
ncbi:MAG TPA: FmdB family zinc ribbon protein [Acidimicrobiia bacterium]|nr:FmdB family zinc ribbon protein [Acidimicrobiia bacterium]